VLSAEKAAKTVGSENCDPLIIVILFLFSEKLSILFFSILLSVSGRGVSRRMALPAYIPRVDTVPLRR